MVNWLGELPLAPGPPWHAMGTRALDATAWLLVDDHRDAELAMKRRLIGERPEVVIASSPGADVAAAEGEVAETVARAAGVRLDPDRPPLVAAALAVQEDLCIIQRDGGGRWRLTSGVVCFPSMWRLADKLGLPLADVHGPVPAYAEELAARVDRFIDRLRVDRPVWRRNWLVHASDELHLPGPPSAPPVPPDVPDGMWLRSERQTLRRLPRTDAVVFTIRTQQVPLRAVAARPQVAAGLADAIAAWSDELVAYRGAAGWRAQLVDWLRHHDAHAEVAALDPRRSRGARGAGERGDVGLPQPDP